MNPQDLRQLERSIDQVWEVGTRMGLNPFPIHFELVPASIMYEFGAYGLPGRFSHWTHGRAFHQIKTMYDYGLSKIYELVVNADPAYAFLLENNSVLQNVVVAAHVLAHVDFFRHNAYFEQTNRHMVDLASTHAERISAYEFEHGQETVERFLDALLSVQSHVDPHWRLRRHSQDEARHGHRHALPYEDLLTDEERDQAVQQRSTGPSSTEPEVDLLAFIGEHAVHLEDWQRDVIDIVRTEQLYFWPQMQTKIMNEGWASFWHARIMRELELPTADFVEFSRMNAAVLATSPGQINPYYVGLKIFEALKREGLPPEGPNAPNATEPSAGLVRLFEVRELDNDVSFLRNYLTESLVEELDLYLYRREGDRLVIVEKDWQKVRDALVASMTNGGIPYITVQDGDYNRNRELYLRHLYEGRELDMAYAERTLRSLYVLWQRTIHLETVVDGKALVLTFDGTESKLRAAA